MSEHPFSHGRRAFCDYLGSPAGRLRGRILAAQLEGFLAARAAPQRVIDVGCGTGTLALSLAGRGCALTLVDPVPAMLDAARRAAERAGLDPLPELRCADLRSLSSARSQPGFDLVICHCLLEYLPSAVAGLAQLTALLAPGGHLSLAVLNGDQEVLRRAVRDGDPSAALAALRCPPRVPSLYGIDRQATDPDTLVAQAQQVGLQVESLYGVLVVGDYLAPAQLSDAAGLSGLVALELEAGAHPRLSRLGRYLHLWARRPASTQIDPPGLPGG